MVINHVSGVHHGYPSSLRTFAAEGYGIGPGTSTTLLWCLDRSQFLVRSGHRISRPAPGAAEFVLRGAYGLWVLDNTGTGGRMSWYTKKSAKSTKTKITWNFNPTNLVDNLKSWIRAITNLHGWSPDLTGWNTWCLGSSIAWWYLGKGATETWCVCGKSWRYAQCLGSKSATFDSFAGKLLDHVGPRCLDEGPLCCHAASGASDGGRLQDRVPGAQTKARMGHVWKTWRWTEIEIKWLNHSWNWKINLHLGTGSCTWQDLHCIFLWAKFWCRDMHA